MAVQPGLDLAQLDPVAAPLDHAVAAADERENAIARIHNHITRPIVPFTGARQKRARRALGQVPVTLHDVRPRNAEFAFLAGRDIGALLVHNATVQVR
jgi:hypothetical protein